MKATQTKPERLTEAERLAAFIAGLPDYDPDQLPEKIPVRFLHHLLGIRHMSLLQLIGRNRMTVAIHGAPETWGSGGRGGNGRYARAWVDRDEFLTWGRETHRLTEDNRPNKARLADIARGATSIDYDKQDDTPADKAPDAGEQED